MRWHVQLCLLLLALVAAGCKDEGTVVVHSINFKGVKTVDAARLRAALATRESAKLPWGKKTYFDRSRFDADLQRIQAFYADRGYPDARVTGFDVKLNGKQDKVDITLTIAEGEPVRVVSVDLAGFDVIPSAHLETLKKEIPLKPGEPRDRQLVVATHEMALNEIRDRGYPYAKVTTSEDDGPTGMEAKLTFTAAPGTIAYFGPVTIQGNKTVGENVIRREVTFKPGDVYRRSLLQDVQRQLYGMELFQFVDVEPIEQDGQPAAVPTRITVAEGSHQRVNVGVGYGTEEKARVDAEYHHLNFLGGARSVGAHVRWSSLDRGARLDFNQPYLFAPHLSLSGEGQQWYTYTPAYRSTTTGGKVTVTHRSDSRTSWAISLTSERDASLVSPDVLKDPTLRNSLIALGLNPVTGEQRGTLNAVGFDLQRSTADNLLNAQHGYQLAFHAEQAGRMVPGTFAYTSVSVDGRHYLPISKTMVVATQFQLGNIQPAGGDETRIPFAKRYFLGGATSVRGWGRYEISPLESGLPIGGDSLLAATAELRIALGGNLGGALFIDTGNVWAGSWQMNPADLRYAIGPGLRYQTPIGPVRVDFGYQLNPNPDLIVNGVPQQRRWRVHFSIGQAF